MLTSYWRNVPVRRFPNLPEEGTLSYDAVVIGGGMTGLSIAYFLKQAGKRVCLLERGRLAAGDTGATSAHLTALTDLRPSVLHHRFGADAARVWQGGEAALDAIEGIVRRHHLECDFQRVPAYLSAPIEAHDNQKEEASLQADLEVAKGWGVAAEWVHCVPYLERSGVVFPHQAKFHPLKYLNGLADEVAGDGSDIFESAEVSQVTADPLEVRCGKTRIRTDFVAIATHVPLVGKSNLAAAALFQTKIAPYTSYVLRATVPGPALQSAMVFDTSDPYFYLRTDVENGVNHVIFGGRDHKTGQVEQTNERFVELEQKLSSLFPNVIVTNHWSGQVIESHDGLPFIGENSPAQFIATGFCGNGITLGTLAGLMARDVVQGKESPWKNLFSPGRLELKSAWEYVKENVDYPVCFVGDRIKKHEPFSPETIEVGEGKVQELDGKAVACSRDANGKFHVVSATCTHLGCLVHWNRAEKSWDCPCHGSRFQPDGKLIAGPAEEPLVEVDTTPLRRAGT